MLPAFPVPLEGPRVLLRPYAPEDGASLKAAVDETREALLRWMSWGDDHRTVERAEAFCASSRLRFEAREDFTLAILERRPGRLLGGSGLHVKDAAARHFELGFWIRASAEGRGYVQETVRLVAEAAFERMGANRLAVTCDADNERSRRVIERAGFPFEGRLRRNGVRPDGSLRDTLVFAMAREDFEEARAAWDAGPVPGG